MSAKTRRTTVIIAAIASATGVALVASLVLGRGAGAPPQRPELTVEIHHGETPHSTLRTATPGDRLIVKAKAAAVVRLYLDGSTLVASCPGDTRCTQQGADSSLELTLEKLGEYRAVLLHGTGERPAPASSMAEDLTAARSAGFSVLAATPVVVQ